METEIIYVKMTYLLAPPLRANICELYYLYILLSLHTLFPSICTDTMSHNGCAIVCEEGNIFFIFIELLLLYYIIKQQYLHLSV